MDDELMTTPELCKWAKVNRTTVWRWREKGLPFYGQGKAIRYQKSEVLKWLEQSGQNNSPK